MNRTPVVFIHGAWLHALSWESWAERFSGRGFLPFTPGWPGKAAAVGELRTSPEAIAGIGLDVLTDHYAGIVSSFDTAPVIVGHSVGGLIAQQLLAANMGPAAAPASTRRWTSSRGTGPVTCSRTRGRCSPSRRPWWA
ncbi:alpha/beta hydrolase [Streptomyces canus]|uniref:alpha/beta hydrolase n=1 Tax=Streptomyces canus TaxID=58343 RepID=UPI0033F0F029